MDIALCADSATGKDCFEPRRLDGIKGIYASPVAAAKRVYFVGRNGTAVVIRHGPKFEVLARNTLDDSFAASPAIANDQIFLRGQKYLYCIAPD